MPIFKKAVGDALRLSFKLEHPIESMKREAAKLSTQDKELVNKNYLEELRRNEKIALDAKQKKEEALREVKKEAEAFNLNCNLVESAVTACQKSGQLEPVQKVFKRGKQTWELFCQHCLPLELSIKNEKPKIVAFLLDNGVDYTSQSSLDITPYEYVLTFSTDNRSIERQEIYLSMTNRILMDIISASASGRLDWFHKALEGPTQVEANTLLNAPIPEKEGITPVMVFAIHNRLATLLFMDNNGFIIDFDKRDNLGKTIFDHAFECGHKELITWICNSSERVLSPLEKASATERPDLKQFDELLKQPFTPEQYNNALIWATLNGHKSIVEKLISTNQVDVQARDNTALVIAVRFKYTEITKILIHAGANPTARLDLPIKVAIEHEQKEVVDCLVNQPNNKGQTALHHASENGDISRVELLLKNGAKINEKMANGWTPLHVASYYGQLNIIKLLKQKGADEAVKDKDGKSYLELDSFGRNRRSYLYKAEAEDERQIIKKLEEELNQVKANGLEYNGKEEIKEQKELTEKEVEYLLVEIRQILYSVNENDFGFPVIRDYILASMRKISPLCSENLLKNTCGPLQVAIAANKTKMIIEILKFGGVFGNIKGVDKSDKIAFVFLCNSSPNLFKNILLKEIAFYLMFGVGKKPAALGLDSDSENEEDEYESEDEIEAPEVGPAGAAPKFTAYYDAKRKEGGQAHQPAEGVAAKAKTV